MGLRRERAGDECPAGEPVADLVRRAARAEASRGGEESERGDQQPEHGAERLEPREIGERRPREDDEADHVREPRWARVLEPSLAEPRLDQLEVRDAGEAPAAPERQPDRELQREERQEPPPPGRDGEQRDEADDDLVDARRALVDQLRVPVGIGSANCLLHFGKYYHVRTVSTCPASRR